ncbi:hypothetical protein [Streptomyces sp. NPDC054849]
MLRQAAAAALAGTGLLAATGPNAQAAQRRAAVLLPPIGAVIPLSLSIFGASLVVPLPPPLPRLNFIGSTTVRVEVGGIDSVRLRTLNFAMEASHPLLGQVTLKLPDIDLSPLGNLREAPDGLVQTWLQSMVMTFERFGELAGPLEFQTVQPARASGRMLSFPPPPLGSNPDGSPTGGAFLTASGPISFESKSPLPVGVPVDLSAVQLQWQGLNEGT